MSIKKQVMKAVYAKIAEAQQACDAEVANLVVERKGSTARARQALSDAFRTFFGELARIKQSFQNRKAEVEARHVNSVLSKIL